MKKFAVLAAIVAVASQLPAQADDDWGDISGQFVFDGAVPTLDPEIVKGDGTVKDAEVY